MREASAKTQFLIATHSPALVNRLKADELLVCQRTEEGATLLPAVDPADIRAKEAVAQGRMDLGELWFSGALGGVPE